MVETLFSREDIALAHSKFANEIADLVEAPMKAQLKMEKEHRDKLKAIRQENLDDVAFAKDPELFRIEQINKELDEEIKLIKELDGTKADMAAAEASALSKVDEVMARFAKDKIEPIKEKSGIGKGVGKAQGLSRFELIAAAGGAGDSEDTELLRQIKNGIIIISQKKGIGI